MKNVSNSQSLEKLRETQAGFRYAADRAREEGLEKGRIEGREEGSEARLISIVKNMKSKGLDELTICNFTNISLSELHRLLTKE